MIKEISLKFVAILMLLTTLVGCSLKEAADNNWEAKTEITPFAPSDSLTKRYGNKITVRIPLAEGLDENGEHTGFGYVDIDEVLGEIIGKPKLDRDSKNFFERLRDGFVLSVGKLAMGAGLFNKFKVSSYFDFEYINQEFITSAKVKRVFFTTENCREGEQDCDNKRNETTNLTFIDKLFINFTNYRDENGRVLADEEGEGVISLGNREFREAAQKSFSQSDLDIANKIKSFNGESIGVLNGDENSINLVKFTSTVPVMNLKFSGVSPTDRELHFGIEDKNQRKAVASYLGGKTLKEFVKKVKGESNGVYVELRQDITPSMLTDKISSDQSPTVAKMVIFRLNSGYARAKRYFKSEQFRNIVKDVSIIGRSVFVELKDVSMKPVFDRIADAENNYRATPLDLYSVDSCIYANCIDVAVNDFNLVPILAANPKLKIDTYFSVKTLGGVDFKYNGFIEVEVELDLPL